VEPIPAPPTTLRDAERRIDDLKLGAAVALWQLGVVLRAVRDGDLWRERDLPSFSAWLDSERVQISRRSAGRAMLIAESCTIDLAERFGVRKLEATARWLEALPQDARPDDLYAADVRVRADDGRYAAVALVEATARQMEAAVSDLKARTAARDADDLDAARERVASVAGERARLSRAADGAVVVSVRGLRVEELRALLAALEAE
jgi:hypothetical protein